MGVMDELKSEGGKSAAMLGMILGFVALWFLWSVSIWLLVLVVAIGGGAFLFFKRR